MLAYGSRVELRLKGSLSDPNDPNVSVARKRAY